MFFPPHRCAAEKRDHRRCAKFNAILLLIAVPSPILAGDTIALTQDTKVRFASPHEGREALRTEDRFTRTLSRFDKQCRMRTSEEVSTEAFLDFVAGEVRRWKVAETEKLSQLLQKIQERLKPYTLALPPEILLIKTSGQEESEAAYCRRHAIVLPQRYVEFPPARLERILIHEIFHVLSSHDAELRAALYAIIGFRLCGPIDLPPQLHERRLTNPDGPLIETLMDIDLDGQKRTIAPALFASVERYDPEVGGNVFRYVVFRLMVVEPDGNGWRPREIDGEPDLLEPGDVASFKEQIGSNTKYIIHPDEILADNFVHLATGNDAVPTPRILEQMRSLLVE
jgi:hypothetical protein